MAVETRLLREGYLVDRYLIQNDLIPSHDKYAMKQPNGGVNEIIKWEYPISEPTLVQLEVVYHEAQAEKEATKYKNIRRDAYPKIRDQLDMMWHDKKDGTSTWEDAVQAVKNTHPKP